VQPPTPVSALIHAATLVTAGIFLIIRCSFIFEYAPITLNFILILGGLTAIFGSTIACCQNDIKRIIAFSTTSQLGYMFFACGLSGYPIALFHLLNHGFFKALLFFMCWNCNFFNVPMNKILENMDV
jgi:NADH:ubiquinone oxidoreductase subunit 5 (subunit L)/multisubunit Na+/H+ antiporter MnhA subunit